MKNYRFFSVILVATLAFSSAVDAGGGKKEWKPFVNWKWGYSLEYPTDWTVKVDVENEGKPERVVRQRLVFRSPQGVPVFVSVWENVSSRSLTEWLDNHKKPSWDNFVEVPEAVNDSVAGKPAISFEIPKACQAFGELIQIFASDGLVFELSYVRIDGGQTLDTFSSIVDSFNVFPKEGER